MSNVAQNDLRSNLATLPKKGMASGCATRKTHRRRPIRVLFVHQDAEVVHNCQQELEKAQFIVTGDVVLTLTQCLKRLRSHSYDLVVAEYRSADSNKSRVGQLLHQTAQKVPVLFVTTVETTESIAQLAAGRNFDYVEQEHLAQLPMAVRRALNEKALRAELEEAGKALRHSQSMYRALAENPAYGICRYDAEGKILDANQAFVTMLGYSSLHFPSCSLMNTRRPRTSLMSR